MHCDALSLVDFRVEFHTVFVSHCTLEVTCIPGGPSLVIIAVVLTVVLRYLKPLKNTSSYCDTQTMKLIACTVMNYQPLGPKGKSATDVSSPSGEFEGLVLETSISFSRWPIYLTDLVVDYLF